MVAVRIGLYHGYELTGSGSNEYTRYLAATLAGQGHDVVVLCADPDPAALPFVGCVVEHDADGSTRTTRVRAAPVTVHRLPPLPVYPVYLTDKQRPGTVKSFADLDDGELSTYVERVAGALGTMLDHERLDVLLCNHTVMQPAIAARVAPERGVPYVVIPHGSAIEYTLRPELAASQHGGRYVAAAREGLAGCAGVVWISDEVRERVHSLLPETAAWLRGKEARIDIGTDTTRFTPIEPKKRRAALRTLAGLHRGGGKARAQRDALASALRAGDLEAVRSQWSSYDQKIEDEDLPALLAGLDPDDDIVLFMGALTWGKGVHALIAAMPALLRSHPRAQLWIVGSGTYREALEAMVLALDDGDLALFERLCAAGRSLDREGRPGSADDVLAYLHSEQGRRQLETARKSIASRVLFFGRLDHERLRWLLPLAKVAAFPSIVLEASPLVVCEALAAGVLPAGSDHSGLRRGFDALADVLPPDLLQSMRLPAEPASRVADIARQIGALLEASRSPALGRTLREIAVQRYDWSGVAQRLTGWLQGLLGQSADR